MRHAQVPPGWHRDGRPPAGGGGPEARAAAGRAAGLSTPALDWPGLRDYRDNMVRHLDDAEQVRGYQQAMLLL